MSDNKISSITSILSIISTLCSVRKLTILFISSIDNKDASLLSIFIFSETLVIIFSSLYLGPVYGAIVGACSDLLGAFVFPTGEYQPLFTLVYGLLGVLPWLLNYLLKMQKGRRFTGILFDFLVVLWMIISMCLVWFYPQIDKLNYKIIFSSISFVLAIGSIVGIHFISRYLNNKDSNYDNKFYRYAIICLICEITVMVFGNSLVKHIHYGASYMLVVEWMALISFINITVNSFGSYYLDYILGKFKK